MLIAKVKFLSPPAETKIDLADEAASALTRVANIPAAESEFYTPVLGVE